jgi:hypothetical protein
MDRDQAEKRIAAIMLPRMLLVVLLFVLGLNAKVWDHPDLGIVAVVFGTVLAAGTLVRAVWLRRRLDQGR